LQYFRLQGNGKDTLVADIPSSHCH